MLKPLQHHPPTSRTEFESGNKYVLETTKEETIERSSLTGYDKRQASFVILWFLSMHSFAENIGRFARCRIRNGFLGKASIFQRFAIAQCLRALEKRNAEHEQNLI